MWRLSALQLQTNLDCRHLKIFVRMHSKTKQVYCKVTTGSNHSPTQARKVVKRESRVQTQRSNAAETRVTNQYVTILVNEQETITNHGPNTLVPSGAQSAVPPSQILVLFSNFNYPPFTWYRGPRPRAHWYMYADVANPSNCHSNLRCVSESLSATK